IGLGVLGLIAAAAALATAAAPPAPRPPPNPRPKGRDNRVPPADGVARAPTERPHRHRRVFFPLGPPLVGVLLLLLALALPLPVFAHANLVRADPPAGAQLPQAPRQLTLFF